MDEQSIRDLFLKFPQGVYGRNETELAHGILSSQLSSAARIYACRLLGARHAFACSRLPFVRFLFSPPPLTAGLKHAGLSLASLLRCLAMRALPAPATCTNSSLHPCTLTPNSTT